jgi:hypothetical protein
MTSVEENNQDQFNQLRQRLSSDLGRKLSENEFVELILQLGNANYDKLLKISKSKLKDTGFTREQYEKALTFIIKDVEENDISENVDEIVYG